MPKFTNTTMAPIHVGSVMIVPGQSADIGSGELLLKSDGFKALLKSGAVHAGEPTAAEKADLAAQEKALDERLADKKAV